MVELLDNWKGLIKNKKKKLFDLLIIEFVIGEIIVL